MLQFADYSEKLQFLADFKMFELVNLSDFKITHFSMKAEYYLLSKYSADVMANFSEPVLDLLNSNSKFRSLAY